MGFPRSLLKLYCWLISILLLVFLGCFFYYQNRPSKPGGLIAFSKDTGRYGLGLYIMNADGTEVTRLSPHSVNSISPAWSLDGKRIAFGCASEDDQYICIISKNEFPDLRSVPLPQVWRYPDWQKNMMPLPEYCSSIGSISWSSDGSRLAFTCLQAIDNNKVCITDFQGFTDCWPVTYLSEPDEKASSMRLGSIAWSPISERMAITVWKDGESSIYLVDPNGENKFYLAEGWNPDWASDGKKLIFIQPDMQIGIPKISMINDDGSELKEIYRPPVSMIDLNTSPVEAWRMNLFLHSSSSVTVSPDGNHIAFTATRSTDIGNSGIFLLDIVADKIVSLTVYGDGEFYTPDWSP